MSKDELTSLIVHAVTLMLSSAGVQAYLSGSDISALAAAGGVLAGVAYKVYLSRKLLDTTPPKKA